MKGILALVLAVAVATSLLIWSPNFYENIFSKRDDFSEKSGELMVLDVVGANDQAQAIDIIENGKIINTEENTESFMLKKLLRPARGERYLKIWVVKSGKYYLCEMQLLEDGDFDIKYKIKPTIAICKAF